MLQMKLQHPNDIITRVLMLDYLKEITPEVAYEKLQETTPGIFYTYTDKDDKEGVDFNWEKLLFHLDLSKVNEIMNQLEEEVFAVEKAQGKIVAKELAKKSDTTRETNINLLDYAKVKIAENKTKIVGLDGKSIKLSGGLL